MSILFARMCPGPHIDDSKAEKISILLHHHHHHHHDHSRGSKSREVVGVVGVAMTLELAVQSDQPHQRKKDLRFIDLKCLVSYC